MGLDMYAYSTSACIPCVDFDHPEDGEEIATWRKHPNLHGWMEELYRAKGGSGIDFNCATLKLTADDIDALERAVLEDELPPTTGFFFGESTADDKWDDLKFIAAARARFAAGDSVFYTSWW